MPRAGLSWALQGMQQGELHWSPLPFPWPDLTCPPSYGSCFSLPPLGANHPAGWFVTFQGLRNPHEVKLPRGFPGPVSTDSFCCWLENVFSKASASLWSSLPLERPWRDLAPGLGVVSHKFWAQSGRVAQAPGVTIQYCRCSPLVGKAESLF